MIEVRRLPFLRIVGVVNIWFIAVFASFLIWGSCLRFSGNHRSVGYLFLYLVPLAAGTGLLSAARRGNLDLLFGSGQTRKSVWWFALQYAFAIPCAMSVVIMAVCEPLTIQTLLRVVAATTLTLGVSFSVGMLETRYFVAIVWLIVRMVYFAAGGTAVLRRLDAGETLSTVQLALASLASPESSIGPRMPSAYVLASALLGIIAIGICYRMFMRADFGGKRS